MRTFLCLFLAATLTACSVDSESNNSVTDVTATADAATEVPQAQFVKQTVAAPLPDLEVPMQSNQVDAEKGGRLTFASGTEVDIPAGAFVYTDGQPVTGRVTIDFREFHTAAEVILSGIPMRDWDDATQSWQNFSTAGMFEVRGTDEAQRPVEIASDRGLEVRLASGMDGTYGAWYFDEEKGDWESIGENTAETYTPPAAATETTAPSARPQAPRKYDSSKIRMEFAGLNLNDFPELQDADKVALQYTGMPGAENDPAENEWIFITNWYEATLRATGQAGVYNLHLENDDETFTTKVQSTLLPAAYPAALEAYRQELIAYENAIQNMEQTRIQTARLRRSMRVARFGIYNYDVYSTWQEPVFAQADFAPATQRAWTGIAQVYLVTDNGSITVRYPKSDWQRFNFDRNRKNLLIGVTDNAEIVLVTPEDFTDQSADLAADVRQGQEWQCSLESTSVKVGAADELQAMIDRHFAG